MIDVNPPLAVETQVNLAVGEASHQVSEILSLQQGHSTHEGPLASPEDCDLEKPVEPEYKLVRVRHDAFIAGVEKTFGLFRELHLVWEDWVLGICLHDYPEYNTTLWNVTTSSDAIAPFEVLEDDWKKYETMLARIDACMQIGVKISGESIPFKLVGIWARRDTLSSETGDPSADVIFDYQRIFDGVSNPRL